MKNVLRIFRADWKRLTASVVAVVVIMGLCLVPCLYAWFNIFSNWDPYGPASTGNIRVAVANEDAGAKIVGIQMNIGDMVTEGLKANDQLGWVFVNNREEALDGVKAGKYYAALVVPKSFSEDFLSVLKNDLRHPQIQYYENQKKNAIAPKITNKAKTAVQDQINETMIQTMANALSTVSSVLRAMGLDADEVSANVVKRLEEARGTMNSLGNTLKALRTTVREADSLLDCTNVVIDDMGQVLQSGEETAAAAKNLFPENPQMDALLKGLDDADQQMQALENSLLEVLKDLDSYRQFINGGLTGMVEQIDKIIQQLQDMANAAGDMQLPMVQERLNKAIQQLQDLKQRLVQLTENDQLENLQPELTAAAQQIQEQIRLAAAALGGGVSTALSNMAAKARAALTDIEGILSAGGEKTDALSKTIAQYDAALGKTQDTLGAGIELTDTLSDLLDGMAQDVERISASPLYKELTDALKNNPEELADYLSSPVRLKTVSVYEISTYGSAMAPYYIMLALFVGSLLAATMVKVQVQTLPPDAISARLWQRYFGRFTLFFGIGMVQALVTGMGCLYYIGVQCLYPGLFLLACCICSLNFAMMNYALVYALDNVGMAIAVVVMVIQVAGSGGAYPVDVLPTLFRKLYAFMPFRYGMDALRETIAGRYGSCYWENIGILLGMCVPFTALGMLLYKPARWLNNAIAKSKEDSGLM